MQIIGKYFLFLKSKISFVSLISITLCYIVADQVLPPWGSSRSRRGGILVYLLYRTTGFISFIPIIRYVNTPDYPRHPAGSPPHGGGTFSFVSLISIRRTYTPDVLVSVVMLSPHHINKYFVLYLFHRPS